MSDLGELLRAEGVTALFFPEGDAAAREIAETLVPFGPFNLTTAGARSAAGSAAVTAGLLGGGRDRRNGDDVETSVGGNTFLPGLIADAVHVSIVPAAVVVARMEEALEATPPTRPGHLVPHRDPQKTADIEQTLTVGAHGPKKAIAPSWRRTLFPYSPVRTRVSR